MKKLVLQIVQLIYIKNVINLCLYSIKVITRHL